MAKTPLEKQIEDLNRLRAKGVLTDEEYDTRRQSLIADTSAAAPPKKKGSAAGGIFKFGFFGCFGVFAAIVVVIVVIVAIVAATGGDSEEGADVRVALAEGSTGEIFAEHNSDKKSRVTILQIEDNPTSDNQFLQPAAGKKYWAVEVEVENVGTAEITSLDWKLRDSTDIESDRAFVSGVGEELEIFYNLTPGGKQRGWVVFEIDADAAPRWLRADPNPFLKNDLYFDAP